MPDALPLPSYADFKKLAAAHTLVPVYRTLTADLETPVSAYLRVAAAESQAFLLESVEGGEKVGRYTFIGVRPYKTLTAYGQQITLVETGRKPVRFTGDIFAELKKHLSGHTPAILPQLPPFTAGAVGFFAYDAVRLIEKLPELAAEEVSAPDACLMFFDEVLAFDHVKKQIHLVVTADLTRTAPRAAYADARKRLDRLERKLAAPLPKPKRKKVLGKLKIKPRTAKAAFLRAVEKTREYIAAGDIFQCVLSQRFDVTPEVDPFAIYRALRIVNPSPYMYYLRFGMDAAANKKSAKKAAAAQKNIPAHIVGSSPELLVRVQGRKIEYRPIAGSAPRSADEAKDREFAEHMRNDPKEIAEHVMLVDLGRNDVGRVSEYGSVRVKDLMFIERYSHIMHLVSSLEGTLRPELTPVDAFRACFPAGTLSGAPKIRAMQIIEELEPARRGVYGGSVFYADFSGNFDSCIAIRTLYMHGEPGKELGHVQSGAGIVADSVPEKEFEECVNKAQAVMRAIEAARG